MALLELFGELGPEPGALLHIEDTAEKEEEGERQHIKLVHAATWSWIRMRAGRGKLMSVQSALLSFPLHQAKFSLR